MGALPKGRLTLAIHSLTAYGASLSVAGVASATQSMDGIRVPISNLVWLLNPNNASQVFSDLTGTTLATNGQNVGYIRDNSLWAVDASAHSVASNGPVLVTGAVNGRSVLRFNGTTHLMRTNDHFGTICGDICYVFAYRPTSTSGFQFIHNTNEPSLSSEIASVMQNGANVVRIGSTDRTATNLQNAWHVICARAGTAEVWQNGTLLVGSSAASKPVYRSGTGTNQYSLGAKMNSGTPANYFAGDIGWFSAHNCGGGAFPVATMLEYARSIGAAFGVPVA